MYLAPFGREYKKIIKKKWGFPPKQLINIGIFVHKIKRIQYTYIHTVIKTPLQSSNGCKKRRWGRILLSNQNNIPDIEFLALLLMLNVTSIFGSLGNSTVTLNWALEEFYKILVQLFLNQTCI